ncbi:MAG: glycosyltransferase family 2 protein [Porticoccus sp.]|nr:glycosyltransferase family 2 protein [Porticoccus sp.]
MKVTIITVCFNSERTINGTIESVLSQTYDNIEYIIVDGNSTDGTMDVVNNYIDDIDIVVSEPDKGIYDAMNKGLSLASGDVIGILNSDDFYTYKDVIKRVVEQFSQYPDSDIVFGDVVFVDPLNTDKIVRFYNSRRFKPWKLRFGWMPPHPATFIKKDTYNSSGQYSLDYKISADYEMFVRLLMVNSGVISRLDGVLVKMRAGGISTSGIRNSFLLNKEIVRACRSNGVYTNFFFILLKLPLKMIELFKKPTDMIS